MKVRRAIAGVAMAVTLGIACLLRTGASDRGDPGRAAKGLPFAASGLHYATTLDGARVDVRVESAAVERREIGPFRIRGFDALRLDGVSVEIEGERVESVAVAPLLADALREVPIGAVTSVAIEGFAVEWRPASGTPVRLVARGAEARAGGSELALRHPRVEPGAAVARVQLGDGIRLISLTNP
ncbi:MAG: hypothetical protein MUF70_10155 [Myxococcota bacterium]|nr:hypothetical protein [Myxococcota bacterium]